MITIICVLAALYLLALAALYTFQRGVLYIPPQVYLTPAGVNLDGAVEVAISDNPNNLLGWWMPPASAQSPVVIFFHGNGSAVYSGHEIYRALHGQGFGVFALAYPGYPGRDETTTQDSLTAAAQGGYDFVAAQGISPNKIVFYGTSLGAGIAAQLSTSRRPALMIMEAPFTSAAAMAQLSFPMFPSAFLIKDKFRSDAALAKADFPLLWIHGTQDNVIPFEMGKRLFEGYDGPKTSHIINGGGHNDVWFRGGQDIVIKAINNLSEQP